MGTNLVQRSVETDLGTFEYTPSPLEDLVEHFARQWRVELPDLKPRDGFDDSVNYALVRRVHDENSGTHVSYYKHGSTELARVAEESDRAFARSTLLRALYETDQPEYESAYLIRDGKKVNIRFEPNGKKEVTFIDRAAQNALRTAEVVGLTHSFIHPDTTMNFHGRGIAKYTADREMADMRAAIGVVRLYFNK